LVAAKQIREDIITFTEFKNILPRFSAFANTKEKNYLNLKHYFKRTIFESFKMKSIDELGVKIRKGEISWMETIENAILFLSDNEARAKLNLKELNSEDQKKPDCSKLPSDLIYENNKPTILDHFAGGWASLKFIGKCMLESLPDLGNEYLKSVLEDFLKDIGNEFLKNLVVIFGSVVTNILGFFALKAVKILWWVIKAIYYIYKALNTEGSESPYKYWGKAVGSGIRIVYTAFMPTERKKLRKF